MLYSAPRHSLSFSVAACFSSVYRDIGNTKLQHVHDRQHPPMLLGFVGIYLPYIRGSHFVPVIAAHGISSPDVCIGISEDGFSTQMAFLHSRHNRTSSFLMNIHRIKGITL